MWSVTWYTLYVRREHTPWDSFSEEGCEHSVHEIDIEKIFLEGYYVKNCKWYVGQVFSKNLIVDIE